MEPSWSGPSSPSYSDSAEEEEELALPSEAGVVDFTGADEALREMVEENGREVMLEVGRNAIL